MWRSNVAKKSFLKPDMLLLAEKNKTGEKKERAFYTRERFAEKHNLKFRRICQKRSELSKVNTFLFAEVQRALFFIKNFPL